MKHPFAVKSTVVAALVSLASFAQSDSPPSTGSSTTDERNRPGARSGSTQTGSDTTMGDQKAGNKNIGTQATFTKDDLDFVKEAVAIGRAEVRLSQLAATQASDPSVKELAQQMVSEHQSTNDELRELIERRGYMLPMDPSMGGSGTTGSGSSIGGSGSTGTTGSPSGSGSTGTTGGTGTSGSIGSGSSSGTPGTDTSDTSGSIGTGMGMGMGMGSGASGSIGGSGTSGTTLGTGGTGSGTTVAIDRSMQKKYDDKYQELSKLSGSKFDRAYLSALVDDHKKSVKLFDKISKRDNADSELKSFATRTLPTLQQHLDRVQSIEKDVKGRRF